MIYEKETLLKTVFIIIKSIIILLFYLYFDKKNNVKRKSIEYIAIFFLCDFYVLFNVVKELKSKDSTSSRSLIIILTILLITNFATDSIINLYNKSNDTSFLTTEIASKYYDRKGLEYSSLEDVVYYTYDGAEFKCDFEHSEYVCIVNTPENKYDTRYDSLLTYVDKDGWIVFTKNILDFDKSKGDFGFYDEEAKEYYASINAVRWNENGTVYWDY